MAATADATFGNVHEALMKAFDAGVVLIIIFAGASWSLGHRTKAIEILIGVCCGYILARHAIDIRNFLKGI
jgi:xanthine/uracil permease